MVKFLDGEELTPAVVFSFSQKRCEQCANAMLSLNLTSSEERHAVHSICAMAMNRLSEVDRQLPQVTQTLALAKVGIGVHHGGMLPILKELVEILFGRGLIKVLWATETFAMGVNMPAKCVVFNGVRKHDGSGFRSLISSEYTQMAGRAGRRGLDEFGTVAMAVWAEDGLPGFQDVKQMLAGNASPLTSRFKLSYSMLLSLLRLEDMNPEDMMKQSYSEFAARRIVGSAGVLQLLQVLRLESQAVDEELRAAVQSSVALVPGLSYGTASNLWRSAVSVLASSARVRNAGDAARPQQGDTVCIRVALPAAEAVTIGWVIDAPSAGAEPNASTLCLALLPAGLQVPSLGEGSAAGGAAAAPSGLKAMGKHGGADGDLEALLMAGVTLGKGKRKGKSKAARAPEVTAMPADTSFLTLGCTWQLVQCPPSALLAASKPLASAARAALPDLAARLPSSVPDAQVQPNGALALKKRDFAAAEYTMPGSWQGALQAASVAIFECSLAAWDKIAQCTLANPSVSAAVAALTQAVLQAHAICASTSAADTGAQLLLGSSDQSAYLAARAVAGMQLSGQLLRALAEPHCEPVLALLLAGYTHSQLQDRQQLLSTRLSATNLSLFPDMRQRLEVLYELEYIQCFTPVEPGQVAIAALDGMVGLTVKGRVAAEMRTVHELVLCEMIFDGVLNDVDPAELAALLAALVASRSGGKGSKDDVSDLPQPPALKAAIDGTLDILHKLADLPNRLDLPGLGEFGDDWARDVASWGATSPVYAWARGLPFATVMTLTNMQEGSFVRLLTQLDECLREVRGAARVIGDHQLFAKAALASHALKRDVCFATSLYVA